MSPGVGCGQVFGLASAPALRPAAYFSRLPDPEGSVPFRSSFSLTAAGQPRNLTGFPFRSAVRARAPARDATYCIVWSASTIYWGSIVTMAHIWGPHPGSGGAVATG